MPQPVISVENLSKAYRLGHKEEVPDTIVGAAKNILTAPWRNFRNLRNLNTNTSKSPLATSDCEDTLWALKDVSFEINQGDVVGIIGRNGAGKSTLLKILSRITEPTSGRAVIRGRVSSLLEVGTGFHPELSGRDNIYMNGTILGMTKKEIDRKFDEIVDFSGIERFLDTVTKRYSSGMQVRLAFAVAAHLDPEILVVDEVLAVGDVAFQRKCFSRMKDVANVGHTVLIVSHDLQAIDNLCKSAVLLSSGSVQSIGEASKCISLYLENSRSQNGNWTAEPSTNPSGLIRQIQWLDENDNPCDRTPYLSSPKVKIEINTQERLSNTSLGISIDDPKSGFRVFGTTSELTFGLADFAPGHHTVILQFDTLTLLPRHYSLTVAIANAASTADIVENAVDIEITYPQDLSIHPNLVLGRDLGVVGQQHEWLFREI